jgi:hypothetical protein
MSMSKESMKWAALGLATVAVAGMALYMASPRGGPEEEKKEEEEPPKAVEAPPKAVEAPSKAIGDDKYIRYGDRSNDFKNPLYDAEW